MDKSKPLCNNCKHHYLGPARDPDMAECFAPQIKKRVNLVTGELERSVVYCSTHRSIPTLFAILLGECGSSGRWFIHKSPLKLVEK